MSDRRWDIRIKATNDTQKKKILDLEKSLLNNREYSNWGKSQLRALALEEGLKKLKRDGATISGFTEEERLLNKIIFLLEGRRLETATLLNVILQGGKEAKNVLKQPSENLKYKFEAVNAMMKEVLNEK